MNRFISIFWGILVFLISLMPYETMAQNTTKTAYQKRMEQIEKELAQKFGYSEPNNIVALEIMNGMYEYLSGKNTSRAKIYSWYINEQEKAKKLKTQADFDREKREQEEALAREKEAEAKRAAELENEKIRNTDYYIIRKNIKNDFEKWNQKGEFESTSAYEERLKSQSVSKFYELCKDELINSYDITAKLQNYNADEQYYPITITFGTHIWREFKIERESYDCKLYISIKDAPEFKKNFYERSNKWEGEITDFVLDADDCLALTKVTYVRYGYNFDAGGYYVHDKYECIVPIKNARKVEFAFKDLEIQNPYCQNAIWNVNTIRLAEEEQRRQDSISCSEYNRVMDSIVTAYNQELLQNEYNFDKATIKFYPCVLDEISGHEHEIKLCLIKDINNITKKYNSLKESFETAKVACTEYNKQLDSIVDTYNQQLLQEEYNFEKQTIKFRKLECCHGIEKRFDKEKVVIDNDYKLIKQRIDSIACIEYNKQLDSIVRVYNQKLLQEEYNFDKKTIEIRHLEFGKEIAKRYGEAKNNISNNYNSIMAEANKNKKTIEDYKLSCFDDIKSFAFENYNQKLYNNAPSCLIKNISQNNTYCKHSQKIVDILIEVTIDMNNQLNKEWAKNGQRFESKVDFFNSYVKFYPYNVVAINPEYKAILKERKKTKK